MPIPPRPVPRAHRRPGHSVPHKSASSSPAKVSSNAASLLDWRAEVAFLDSFATSKPHSMPMPSGGVVIMDAATRARTMATAQAGAGSGDRAREGGRREVDLEQLIQDGKGKREKRATTAASLGFDFVHNPSVLVLPDTDAPRLSTPAHSSLLATSRPKSPLVSARPASPLAKTPQTPGLVLVHASNSTSADLSRSRNASADGDDESDLDEWEHVQLAHADAEDGDEMILGELELEDDLGQLSLIDKREAVGMRRVDGLSYAAALGKRREQGQVA